MDKVCISLVSAVLIQFLLLSTAADASLSCFKKILPGDGNKPDLCKEIFQKSDTKTFKSPKGCCNNGGAGFIRGPLIAKGKKKSKYACYSCEPLIRATTALSNTTASTSTASISIESTTLPMTSAPTTRDLFEGNPNRTGWSDWSDWSQCSRTCEPGVQFRTRICGSVCVGEEVESKSCILAPDCPVNGGWGPWTSYSDCSEPCGGGTKTRTRTCNKPIPRSNGLDCEGNSVDAQPCNVDPCAVDGGWTPWQDWSACSGTCGNGMKSRTRECSDPAPAHGGAPCVGNSTKEIACSHSTPCPVDGGWSLWYEWSSCGITCGTGTRHRRRKCVAPKPRHGGADCPGNSTDVTLCYHSIPCPIDGQWTDWEPWAQCLAPPCTGEVGYTTRKRTCKNPQPRFNGNPCEGNSIETQQCLNNENCPVHGGWCAWGNYSNCRPSNIGRFKLRMRDCACPTPESGGNPCTGVDYEVVKCVGVNRFGIPCPDSRTFGYTDDELNEVNQESSGFYDEFEC